MDRIIESLLDNDFYNFTMGQFIWRHYRGTNVRYAFTNRTHGLPLAKHVDLAELDNQIAAVRRLRFTDAELAWLAQNGPFDPEYLEWLRDELRLPEVSVMATADGQLAIHYEGDWAAAVFWETMLLALVSELRCREYDTAATRAEGARRLAADIKLLAARPDVKFSEFGSRRRFSADWQRHVLGELVDSLSAAQLTGTSNAKLAMDFGLRPIGTMAHQLFMVVTALKMATGSTDAIRDAQVEILDRWEDMYAGWENGRLLTVLPDTYGTRTFLRHFEPERLRLPWRMRQDSGDAAVESRRWLDFVAAAGFDPADHRVMPSDGLTPAAMIELTDEFGDLIAGFGIGTHLSNNLGVPSASMVIKPEVANGAGCVKLSDNAAKAVGPAELVAEYRRLADLAVGFSQECEV